MTIVLRKSDDGYVYQSIATGATFRILVDPEGGYNVERDGEWATWFNTLTEIRSYLSSYESRNSE